MTKFKITSTAGVDLGAYTAADEAAALDVMARDAGYADYAEAQATAPALKDLIVEAGEAGHKIRIRIGDRVEGGEGEDYDIGTVQAIISPPHGECDVMVAWDTGVSTPAVSSDLRRIASWGEADEAGQRSYADLHSDMTEWLVGVLKPGADAARYATALIEESEPHDGEIHVEVRGLHSRTKNPITAQFDYFDDEDGYGWREFVAYNSPAIYGYGTPDEASAYQDHLNAGREINHYAVNYVTLAEARERGLWDRDDTLSLTDALTDIEATDTAFPR